MSALLEYVKLIIQKLLTLGGALSTLSWTAALYFGNSVLPETIPSLFLGIMLFMLTLLICGWRVWMDVQNTLKKFENSEPRFDVRAIDVKCRIVEDLQKDISQKIQSARASLEEAPNDNPLVVAMTWSRPTKGSWRSYIDELEEMKVNVEKLGKSPERIMQLDIKNIGNTSDTSISIDMKVEDAIFLPRNYDDNITFKMPSEPSRHLSAALFAPAHRHGGEFARNIVAEREDRISVEFSRLRVGESASLLSDPIFVSIRGLSPKVKYEIKSDKLSQPILGSIDIP